jgi:hypothetical protein
VRNIVRHKIVNFSIRCFPCWVWQYARANINRIKALWAMFPYVL